MGAGLLLCTAACKDTSWEPPWSCRPGAVAQSPGCSSRADLRVSGPWSTSSSVMWLPHTAPHTAVPGGTVEQQAAVLGAGRRPQGAQGLQSPVLLCPGAQVPQEPQVLSLLPGCHTECPQIPLSSAPQELGQGGHWAGQAAADAEPHCHRPWLRGQPGSTISSHCRHREGMGTPRGQGRTLRDQHSHRFAGRAG